MEKMMAKIVIEVDTETRAMTVSLNGAAIDNVKYVSCNAADVEEEKEYGYKQTMCCISKSSEKDEVRYYEQICAGENEFSPQKDTVKDLSVYFKQSLAKLR